jgi:hypothetical protein
VSGMETWETEGARCGESTIARTVHHVPVFHERTVDPGSVVTYEGRAVFVCRQASRRGVRT